MQTKNTNNDAARDAGQFIILCEGRGDYLTGLGAGGEIKGGSRAEAIRYTAAEAREMVESLGRGYSIEPEPQFSTHLGFSEYHGELHLYGGNFEESARGSKEHVAAFLRSLLTLVPADEESLMWQGQNGMWYSGDEARAAIKAEILSPEADDLEAD